MVDGKSFPGRRGVWWLITDHIIGLHWCFAVTSVIARWLSTAPPVGSGEVWYCDRWCCAAVYRMSGDTFALEFWGMSTCTSWIVVPREKSMRKDNVNLFREALKVTSIRTIVNCDKKAVFKPCHRIHTP
ncbi:hypothetical protein BKA58DRAFT_30275 [Alternaria rosae]|uniref:uncharacterized protein n=1 Tax=Alternaria rosae TaxID=1187941 RepID=UPI001E8D35C2|nr:uncharacterized protein BKA58DRAFT_30275 [Alternaria rosae]KAH6883095.1 hypothetical protein BKA58DRAFT_30275 [Alternaria rosae]